MSIWLSYSLEGFIPFGADGYSRLFANINETLWPWQLLALAGGIFLVFVCRRGYTRLALLMLAMAWFVSGALFHYVYFSALVWAAHWFAYGFFIQAGLLIVAALIPDKTHQSDSRGAQTIEPAGNQRVGIVVLVLALALFPLLGIIRNNIPLQAEVFAVMPDPTCLATFGVLLYRMRLSWWLLIIPILWSLISATISYVLGLYSGFLLLFMGCATAALALLYGYTSRKAQSQP